LRNKRIIIKANEYTGTFAFLPKLDQLQKTKEPACNGTGILQF